MRTRTLFLIGLGLGLAALFAAATRRRAVDAERRHREELLDEALVETFPASDPISVY